MKLIENNLEIYGKENIYLFTKRKIICKSMNIAEKIYFDKFVTQKILKIFTWVK